MEESIVVATEEDLSAIFALQQRSFRLIVQNVAKEDPLPLWQTEEELRNDARNYIILKYVSNGRIIGTVRGRLIENGNCYVSKLAVDPAQNNKGIGRKLMETVESYFPDCRGFELFTTVATPNTCHLYKSLGYEITGISQDKLGVTLAYFSKRNHNLRK